MKLDCPYKKVLSLWLGSIGGRLLTVNHIINESDCHDIADDRECRADETSNRGGRPIKIDVDGQLFSMRACV